MVKSRKLKMELRRTAKERSVSFTKRRQGLFSKAANFCVISDAHIALWVTSPCATGKTYSFTSHHSINRMLDRFLHSSVPEPVNLAEKVSAISLWREINSLESNASLEEFENCNSVEVLRGIVERLESVRNGLISRINGGRILGTVASDFILDNNFNNGGQVIDSSLLNWEISQYDYENDECFCNNIDGFDLSAEF